MYQWWRTWRFDNTKGAVNMRIFLRRLVTSYLAALMVITCWPVATHCNAQTVAERINWPAYEEMAVDLMRLYLRINTSNPPANEIQTPKFFKAIFEKQGIHTEIFKSKQGRANLIARLKGTAS